MEISNFKKQSVIYTQYLIGKLFIHFIQNSCRFIILFLVEIINRKSDETISIVLNHSFMVIIKVNIRIIQPPEFEAGQIIITVAGILKKLLAQHLFVYKFNSPRSFFRHESECH